MKGQKLRVLVTRFMSSGEEMEDANTLGLKRFVTRPISCDSSKF